MSKKKQQRKPNAPRTGPTWPKYKRPPGEDGTIPIIMNNKNLRASPGVTHTWAGKFDPDHRRNLWIEPKPTETIDYPTAMAVWLTLEYGMDYMEAAHRVAESMACAIALYGKDMALIDVAAMVEINLKVDPPTAIMPATPLSA